MIITMSTLYHIVHIQSLIYRALYELHTCSMSVLMHYLDWRATATRATADIISESKVQLALWIDFLAMSVRTKHTKSRIGGQFNVISLFPPPTEHDSGFITQLEKIPFPYTAVEWGLFTLFSINRDQSWNGNELFYEACPMSGRES